MKILITGKDGQLGKSLQKVVNTEKQSNNFVLVGRGELDLEHDTNIDQYFKEHQFDCIINCAAYTAVDKAESNIDLANQINHLAVKKLATIARQSGTRLIHISTDYVFDGKSTQPYTELDQTNPVNIYGKTKLAGEQAIQNLMPANAIIIRTSWVYSEYGNNFVDTMLRLGKDRSDLNVVADQIGSPTYAKDLAKTILAILRTKEFQKGNYTTQIYHYSNQGFCSWYEFAKQIFKLSNTPCSVSPITTKEYLAPAVRPQNTLMSKDKIIKKFNLKIPNRDKSLYTCITSLQRMK